ncbi:hypothetical protein JHK87_040046 [Glycine soja]|nr:hypothetical protein JHK87_040046 [Glycine soja]
MSIKVDLDGDQIKNPVFDSEEKAFDSYTRYATSHGHVVRKDGVSRDVHGKAIKHKAHSLHSFDVRTCYIMGCLLAQKGSYGSVCFEKSDLYNHLHRKKCLLITEGDVRVALSYLKGKTVINPMFYSKIETASNGKLKHLG